MTPKQISLIERIIPYVEYMLARRIPYVPPRLWDDCRSIAYMSLCEYVAKQDDEDASWVSEFAFKRMKDAVIKFLVSEKVRRRSFHPTSCRQKRRILQDRRRSYFRSG